MDYLSPFYKRPGFWQKFIPAIFLVLFLLVFRDDLLPGLRGWITLIWIIVSSNFKLLNQSYRGQVFLVGDFNSDVLASMGRLFFGVASYGIVYLISLFTVAQFTLPINIWKDRVEAFKRLLFYGLNWHGPAVFVREGKLITSAGEKDAIGPGVALVDLSSAIVLEQQPWEEEKNDTEDDAPSVSRKSIRPSFLHRKIYDQRQADETPWLRVVGPGVNFTSWGEKIHSVIDLRRQVRTDPGIKAYTRDGIEIQTGVYTVFSLCDPPDVMPVAYVGGNSKEHLYALDMIEENNSISIKAKYPLDPVDAEEIHSLVDAGRISPAETPSPRAISKNNKTFYPYDEKRVFAAACAEAQYLPLEEKRTLWHQLPQYIAIDIFQDLLAHYTYDHLYSPYSLQEDSGIEDNSGGPKRNKTPFLKKLKSEFNFKVRYQGILSYKLVRLSTSGLTRKGHVPKWNETPLNDRYFDEDSWAVSEFDFSAGYPFSASKVLRDRGIKIVVAGFPEIKSPPEIRAQIVDNWMARLEREIKITQAKHEREAMQVINGARTQTQRENAFFLSNIFNNEIYSQEALALLLFQSLENAATDPRNHKDMPPKEILAMLQNLHRWLLIERKEAERKDKAHQGDNPTDTPPDSSPAGPKNQH